MEASGVLDYGGLTVHDLLVCTYCPVYIHTYISVLCTYVCMYCPVYICMYISVLCTYVHICPVYIRTYLSCVHTYISVLCTYVHICPVYIRTYVSVLCTYIHTYLFCVHTVCTFSVHVCLAQSSTGLLETDVKCCIAGHEVWCLGRTDISSKSPFFTIGTLRGTYVCIVCCCCSVCWYSRLGWPG